MIHYQCMMMTVRKALTRVCFMDFDTGKVKYDDQAQSRIVSPCKFISDLSCSHLNESHFLSGITVAVLNPEATTLSNVQSQPRKIKPSMILLGRSFDQM
jgi:hypothetical protein